MVRGTSKGQPMRDDVDDEASLTQPRPSAVRIALIPTRRPRMRRGRGRAARRHDSSSFPRPVQRSPTMRGRRVMRLPLTRRSAL